MSKSEITRYICVATIALAGLVHLFIAPAHYGHAPAHGIFFAMAGLVQCAWVIAFWRRPSLTLYRLGLAVSGGLVVLWLLTLALPAPFGGHDSGSIDTPALVCKLSETIGLVALVALVMQGGQLALAGALSAPRLMSEALLVSLLVGGAFFGVGKVAEPLFPQWQHGAEHLPAAEHGDHSHDGEHAHDEAGHEHGDEATEPDHHGDEQPDHDADHDDHDEH
jgi:hypothetical protein